MTTIDYIGFDIHKKTISFCVRGRQLHTETNDLPERIDFYLPLRFTRRTNKATGI